MVMNSAQLYVAAIDSRCARNEDDIKCPDCARRYWNDRSFNAFSNSCDIRSNSSATGDLVCVCGVDATVLEDPDNVEGEVSMSDCVLGFAHIRADIGELNDEMESLQER